jgi:DNA-binding GntR family transcriptional regulator
MVARAAALTPEAGAAGSPVGTATQRVYDGIYQAIVEHRLAPGTRLREEELAESFAVSRTVVRQALHRLAQDHVVELQHNRGAQVPAPSYEDAAMVFDARRVIEVEIARRLTGRLSPEQQQGLRAIARREAEADARGDRAAAIRHSGELHRTLARLAGNPVFVRMLDELLPTTSLLMALYQRPGRPACVAHKHEDLIDALASDRPTQGAAEMRRHLDELQRSLAPAGGGPQRPLRDIFAPYREPPVGAGAAVAAVKPRRAASRAR